MEFWKLNLKEIGILKIIWELRFWKLNLGIGSLEIKFERNWSFENYLRIGVLKISFKNWSFWKLILKENGVSKIRVLKIKLRNWSFEKYLKIGILDNYLKIEVLEIKFRD